MHRIDGAGATVDKQFTLGNPATGVPATTVTPDWANDVQGNLCRIIEAAGIALVKGDFDQLLAAVQAIANAAVAAGTAATTLLNAIKSVDGAGSGLDADLLDGLSSSAFATAAQGTKADNAIPNSYLDTNTSLANNSDTKVATQKAVKSFVEGRAPKITVLALSTTANVVLPAMEVGEIIIASRPTTASSYSIAAPSGGASYRLILLGGGWSGTSGYIYAPSNVIVGATTTAGTIILMRVS